MPAQRIDDRPVVVHKYDVAGQDSASKFEFVRHIGLAAHGHSGVNTASPHVALVHMGPPLRNDAVGTPIHAVGTVTLNSDELQRVAVFIDELANEYEAEKTRRRTAQYVILPHVREPDLDYPCRRFSCAGFVIEAYGYAGINLLITGEDVVPAVGLESLKEAYSDLARRLDHADQRARFGLDGPGPWPIILAGYVVHALDRPEAEIRESPYLPVSGDEYFPRASGQVER